MKGFYKHFAPGGATNNRLGRRLFAKGGRRTLVLSLLLFGTILSVSVLVRYASAQSPDEHPGVAELKKGDYEAAIKSFTNRITAWIQPIQVF